MRLRPGPAPASERERARLLARVPGSCLGAGYVCANSRTRGCKAGACLSISVPPPPTTVYAKAVCALTQARRANEKTVRQYTNAALPPARYASEHGLDLLP
eukprot:483925-Alexandrium_andersonii.AAC.1